MSSLPPVERTRAYRLLLRLLELPREERSVALEASGEDTAVRGTVLRLLQEADKPGSPVVDPDGDRSRRLWTGFAAQAAERETPLAEGDRLGPYRIVEEIERGGMAVVYRAERVDGEFTREVAVKVLKLGLDTEEVVRRFEQERQILADLDHPSIARMHDGGRTGDGRPYFVMELVEGVPIDRYCDERRLTVEERLELFCVVVGAVEYAHQNLVVHRDLKPSNILVNAAGQVKLLDFGIARLVDMEAGDGGAAAPTRAVVRMMTPEYASPEQVRGERVTTASDVYQLGLLLYELLSGHRAHALGDRSAGALERAICEQVPTRPSAAVLRPDTAMWPADVSAVAAAAADGDADLKRPASVPAGVGDGIEVEPPGRSAPSEAAGATIEAICQARCTTPARLRRRLRGDLDNIVLMALRKEPERRYRTADRLVLDIRRHLEALPVTARADTWVYRGRKFLARHAIGATATALVLIAATAGTGFYTARIQSERDQAQAAERRAQAEAAKAEEVSRFLGSLFESADPTEARGAEVTARELLDRGTARLDRELAGQPEVRAEMLQILGRTYTELGLHDSAERLLTEAFELRRSRLGARHPDVAGTLTDLGRLRALQGAYARAVEILEEAVRKLEASQGGDTAELARALQLLGATYMDFNRYDEARATFGRALAIHRRLSGEESLEAGGVLYDLGALHFDIGALERAEEIFERVLVIYERDLGVDHPRVGGILANLASIRSNRGELDGLEAMYLRDLEIQTKAYGADHLRVGMALSHLGDFLLRSERYDDAAEALQRAVEVYGRAVGPDHPDTAYPLTTLGDAYLAAGRPREARRYYRRSVAVQEAGGEVGDSRFDPLLAYSLARLGRVEADLADAAAADRILTRALALWRRAPETMHPQFAPALVDLGRWLAGQGRCAEAVPLLRRARGSGGSSESPPNPVAAEAEGLLAECGAPVDDLDATVAAANRP